MTPRPSASVVGRCLLLGALVAASFLPVLLFGGFAFDDLEYVRNNPLLLDVDGLRRIWWPGAGETSASGYGIDEHYWPVLYSTFWLERRLWGGFFGPGFHATNVVLHLVNAGLLWAVLTRLRVPCAFAVAVVFAVHPSQMEAPSFVIGRKDLLSTFFLLLALLLWFRSDTARKADPDRRSDTDRRSDPLPSWRRVLLVLALACLGVLSKTVVALLPVWIAVVHWARGGSFGRPAWSRLLLLACPLLALAAWGWYVYASGLNRMPSSADLPRLDSVLLAATTFWNHLYLSIVPSPAGLGFYFWDVSPSSALAWCALAGLLALGAILFHARGRLGRGPTAVCLLFGIALLPYLGLIDHQGLVGSFNNSRHRYLAAVFPWILLLGAAPRLAAALARRAPSVGPRLPFLARLLAILGLGLAVSMHFRHGFAYTSDALWYAHLEAVSPASARAPGWVLDRRVPSLLREGRTAQALAYARGRTLRHPASLSAQVRLAQALQAQDRGDEALAIGLDVLDDWGSRVVRGIPFGLPHASNAPAHPIDPDAPPPAPLGAADLWLLRRQVADLFAARGNADASAAFARAAAAIRPPPGQEWVFLRGDGSVFRVEGPERVSRGGAP